MQLWNGQLAGCATTKIYCFNAIVFYLLLSSPNFFHLLYHRINILLTQLDARRRIEAAIDAATLAKGYMDIKTSHKTMQKY